MPFTSQEISDAGKAVLDFYIRNNPIDQVGMERPLYKALSKGKQSAPGGKQYIVEQLRKQYQSNFQWFNGAQVVTYNRRQTLEQAQYPWRSAHDGFSIDEDRLIQHGIKVSDDGPGGTASDSEMMILTNLLKEQLEVLRLGFIEQFSIALHLDGTQATDAVEGLDKIISYTTTSGTVGGINKATEVWWRNYAATGLTYATSAGDIVDKMELARRACITNGGAGPFVIIAGSTFYDAYRTFNAVNFGRMDFTPNQPRQIDAGTNKLMFWGDEMQWSPEFAVLDTLATASPVWEKRCYFLNTRHLKLRPIEGQDMLTRKPPRAYDRYEYYWGLTWRGALTSNRLNAHAAVSVT